MSRLSRVAGALLALATLLSPAVCSPRQWPMVGIVPVDGAPAVLARISPKRMILLGEPPAGWTRTGKTLRDFEDGGEYRVPFGRVSRAVAFTPEQVRALAPGEVMIGVPDPVWQTE